MKNDSKTIPICLSIAGLDPSGGAGVLADIKTFSAFGCFGTAAITSITFQNTRGVFGAISQTAESVRQQIQPLLDDFEVGSVKTGMLPTRAVIEQIARTIKAKNLKNFVVDPVVRSTSGFDLIDDEALNSLIESLFPLSDLVTPNIAEAERVSGMKLEREDDIERIVRKIQSLGAKNVLLKGGHSFEIRGLRANNTRTARDYLFVGNDLHIFDGEFYETTATHGTGCTLSAAITANLALGIDLVEAVGIAKRFVNEAIRTAPNIGRGHSPINHHLSEFINTAGIKSGSGS